jgi:hypothetical protein
MAGRALTGRRIPVRFGVRSTVAFVAILILGGAGIFAWQRSQIAHLRAQVARQGEALDHLSDRLDGAALGTRLTAHAETAALRAPSLGNPYDGSAEMRADERRIIVDQYRDVLAQMNLPPETASRLLDLLTDRIETVLDAQDAAVREGFAEGSAQTARAVSLAIAEVDRDIVGLVGQEGIRRIDGLPVAPPEPAFAPAPAAPIVVTVVVQAPPPAYESDSAAQPAASDGYPQYVSYPYPYFPLYPIAAVLNGPRRFAGPGNGRERTHRDSVRINFR